MMNRVLRSPEISERPYVISAKVQGTATQSPDTDEEGFQGLDASDDTPEPGIAPEEDEREGDGQEAEESASTDETESPDADSADPKTDAPSGDEDASGSSAPDSEGQASDQVSEERADSESDGDGSTEDQPSDEAGSEGEAPPDGLTPEDGEMMIGLEKVAERDAAAAVSPSEPTEETVEELPAPASEIESIVEARLQEFEERFQQEKEDAYHSGFEDGTNEGMKQGLNQSEDEVARFQELVDTLTGQWKDTLRTNDASVVELAVRVAQKIIDVKIETDDEAVLQAVHECLGYVEDKTKVIIRVNPDDLEAVRRHRNDWLESLESIDHLLIEAEPTVSRGGCVVETPIGDVDAQIEERLERLRLAMLEEINRTDSEEN